MDIEKETEIKFYILTMFNFNYQVEISSKQLDILTQSLAEKTRLNI